MTAPHPPQEANADPLTERARARDSQLLIDEFLPRYDFAVVHASVLPARPEACYRAALGVDLLRDPVIRSLLGIRSLPQRLADRFAPRHRAAAAEPPRTFRLGEMVRYGWIVLDEEPNVELVLGQIGRPWKSAAASSATAGRTGRVRRFRPSRVRKDRRQPQGRALRGHRVDPHDRDTGRADRPAEPATVHPLLDIHPSLQRSDSPERTTTGRCRPAPVRSIEPHGPASSRTSHHDQGARHPSPGCLREPPWSDRRDCGSHRHAPRRFWSLCRPTRGRRGRDARRLRRGRARRTGV